MPPGGRVYHTGGRERSILPGDTKKIFVWHMPAGLHGVDRRQDQRNNWGECGDDAAPSVVASVCVKLGVDPDPTANKQIFPDGVHVNWSDAFLRVSFGSGSGGTDDSDVELDLINGDSFPLVARDAEFYCIYPKNDNPQSPIVQPIIDVSISVGIGVVGAAGERGARRSIKLGNLNSAQSNVFPVPRYAVGAVLQSTDAATAAAVLTQRCAPVAGADILAISTIQKQEYQSVPIVNGARGFDVTTTTNATGVSVIFYLSPA